MVRVQVLLDRANFSAGSIDGRWGKNSEIAAYWFQSAHGLPPTGEADSATLRALVAAAGNLPAVRSYNLAPSDLKGPFRAIPQLRPGPNSPVGVVWMALSKPHYGIHGTSEPETIGYATSHGCVRLTNWDAHDVAHRVAQGIAVAFVDPRHHEEGGH